MDTSIGDRMIPKDGLGVDVLLFGSVLMVIALLIMGFAAYKHTTVVPSCAERFARLQHRFEYVYVARMGSQVAWSKKWIL